MDVSGCCLKSVRLLNVNTTQQREDVWLRVDRDSNQHSKEYFGSERKVVLGSKLMVYRKTVHLHRKSSRDLRSECPHSML
jgi:hypothetical protein